MTAREFYELRDSGKITVKCMFLNEDETVVETSVIDGVYYIAEAHLDLQRETTKEAVLHEFKTAEEANRYFKEFIKTGKGYFKREWQRQQNAYGDYIERMVGTVD